MNNLQITLGKEIQQGEKTFTQLIGGFGQNNPMISAKQLGELLGYSNGVKSVNLIMNRNQEHFKEGMDYIDLKSEVSQRNHENIFNILTEIGYTQNGLNRSKNIYIFSQAGFLLFLKFAEGDKAVEIYKNFIEDYFKTKVENKNMKLSIEEEIQKLKEDKKSLLGEMFMENDEGKKIELFNKNEELNRRITKLEKSMSEKEIVMKLQPKLSIVDKFTNSDGYFDIGTFSKILNIKNMGRNKLFRWMKDQKILMEDNEPYQKYMDYFKVFPVTSKSGMIFNKTMIKPKGITYIFKRLIQDNKIIPKSIDKVIEELEAQPKTTMNI